MNLISLQKKALEDSFLFVRSNKWLTVLLVFLQLILFLGITTLCMVFVPKIIGNTQEIMNHVGSVGANTDPAFEILQRQIPQGTNIQLIDEKYGQIKQDLFFLAAWILVLYTISNGTIWYMIAAKKDKIKTTLKKTTAFLFKYAALAIALFFFYGLLLVNTLNMQFSALLGKDPKLSFVFIVLSTIGILYAFSAIPFLNNFKKTTFKELFFFGISNWPKIVISFVVMIAVIGIGIYGLSITMASIVTENASLKMVSIVITLYILFMFVFTKIYFYNVIRELKE